jgi:hypothetical protein
MFQATSSGKILFIVAYWHHITILFFQMKEHVIVIGVL